MVEPFSTASLVAIAKKEGARAAVLAYKHALPHFALRMTSRGVKGLGKPRPRVALVRALRKDESALLLAITEAVIGDAPAAPPGLVEEVERALGRSRRWRRLEPQVRAARAAQVAENLVKGFLPSLEAAEAVAAADRANRSRAERVERGLEAVGAAQAQMTSQLQAGQAAEFDARLRERLSRLPVIAQAALQSAPDDPDVVEVAHTVTAPGVKPGEVAAAWVDRPPAHLGDAAAPRRAAAWRALAHVAFAYGGYAASSTAFTRAAAAGGGPRTDLCAFAAWALINDGNTEGAATLLAGADSDDAATPALRLVTLMLQVGADGPGEVGAGSAGPAPQDEECARLCAEARAVIAGWDPAEPFERDLRARVGAQIEIADPSRPQGERWEAALGVLDQTLKRTWIVETAIAAGYVLRARAQSGVSKDRAADLERAYDLALAARAELQRTGGDTRRAVRDAAEAASFARRWRQVIEVGSAIFGNATEHEAQDPATMRYVAWAALHSAPHIGDAIEQQIEQMPEGFMRAWLRAFFSSGRPGRPPTHSPRERGELWRAAAAAATTDADRELAEYGAVSEGVAAAAGEADGPPQTWYGAELVAQTALSSGNPAAAVAALLPFRHESPTAASILAQSYVALDQTDSAIEVLTQAAVQFDFDDLIVAAAQHAQDAGDLARARELLEEVLRTASPAWAGRAQALMYLGQVQSALGARIEALASWTTSLEQDPFNDRTRWLLAHAHAARSDFDKAWATLTADPATPGTRREPLTPPNADLAHLLLVTAFHTQAPQELVTRGLELLDRFGDDVEFAAGALAVMLAATTHDPDTASEPRPPLNENLAARLQTAVGNFMSAHPGHPTLHSVTIDPNASGEELLALLASRIEPVPQQQQQALKAALFAVARGVYPLGTIAALTPRRYARLLAEQTTNVLTARTDEAEHLQSLDEALSALGLDLGEPASSPADGASRPSAQGLIRAVTVPTATVTIDTTALYTRSLLPDLDTILTAGLREVVLADEAFTDIIAAQKEMEREQGLVVFRDESGRVGLSETPTEIRARSLERIAAMRAFALTTRRHPAPGVTQPGLDALAAQRPMAWLEAVRLAASLKAFLWADDVALRALARHFGVRCFSTSALLDALQQLGKLTSPQHEQAVQALVRGQVGDMPLDWDRLRTVSRRDLIGCDAVIHALAKPSVWLRPHPATEVFTNLLRGLLARLPGSVPWLTAAAVLGNLCLELPPQLALERVAPILATAINAVGPMGDVRAVIEAVRAALRQAPTPQPDPLLEAAKRLLRAQTALTDAQTAAATLTALMAQCSEADQRIARLAILTA